MTLVWRIARSWLQRRDEELDSSTEEDDRILEEIYRDRKRESRREIFE